MDYFARHHHAVFSFPFLSRCTKGMFLGFPDHDVCCDSFWTFFPSPMFAYVSLFLKILLVVFWQCFAMFSQPWPD